MQNALSVKSSALFPERIDSVDEFVVRMGNLCVCSDALLSQGEQDVGVAYDNRRNNEMDHVPAHGVLKVVELL